MKSVRVEASRDDKFSAEIQEFTRVKYLANRQSESDKKESARPFQTIASSIIKGAMCC